MRLLAGTLILHTRKKKKLDDKPSPYLRQEQPSGSVEGMVRIATIYIERYIYIYI